ncbi:hypothetical protein [Polyangium sorediatum]|uniref:Uncharacterized protein n=1 Tax=Polyangium sorediatum TaxID=889274 RepID=A0ABT6NQY1_9BACT|nr:hypothetical protein [Polyangium sorediatum]MDI1430737.1 hypothetical protein [Polyangium sorediatum]
MESAKTVGDTFEQKAGVYLIKQEGRQMLGVGDPAVRRVLGLPKPNGAPRGAAVAPDYLTVTKENMLAVSEVKSGGVEGGKVVEQLTNAMKKLKEKNLHGDVAHLELIMSKGATMSNAYEVVGDTLMKVTEEGKEVVRIEGHVIRVIQL